MKGHHLRSKEPYSPDNTEKTFFFPLFNLNYAFTLISPTTLFTPPAFPLPLLILSGSYRLAPELLHSQKEKILAPPFQWMLTKRSTRQHRPIPLEQPHEKTAEVLRREGRKGREVTGFLLLRAKFKPFLHHKGPCCWQ